MTIAIAQINPTVGDLDRNLEKISDHIAKARMKGVKLVVFPELCVTGYPPKDLLSKKAFVKKNKEILEKVVGLSRDMGLIIGFVDEREGRLFNAAAVIEDGELKAVYHKMNLPNYDVFDEKRYFTPGSQAVSLAVAGFRVGLTICEDIWVEDGPVSNFSGSNTDLIINISGSPYHLGKRKLREDLLRKRALESGLPIVYANLVGAQDDLIFDGRSYVFNQKGEKIAEAKSFEEDLLIVDDLITAPIVVSEEEEMKDLYQALVLGIRDYFQKNGFKKTVLGLSGGIDSALTAVLAVEALGKENVRGISMPSKFSSSGSVDDAKALAENLGIDLQVVPIKAVFDNYLETLNPHFEGMPFNVAEENIQARIRGNFLMALSNKFGYLVLTTGNKSELSVGYATLYGDMCGGLAVISDVFKTKVYDLSRYINQQAGKEIIPSSTITKEPSAELREDQRDTDSLPPYEMLDAILREYIENDKGKEEIAALGFSEELVKKIISMVDRSEYKRQQAALGLKVSPLAFGSGRRVPITNRWKE
ncbi:NAD+ synthase [Candidatus Woesearchaeota archaeon CG10_big_fil_rev_8_21_14_0_10_45_16]|nr:MAG: NAD+ synthase [Candidatus Woesearchaeota archaeon CG10_big_fil_rev_8_21_14_0_10_45_16]